MPMPTLTAVAEDQTVPGPKNHLRPTIVPPPVTASAELSPRPRRSFTAQEKLRILAETDRAAQTGEIGAVLRREGISSSLLTDWRRQRDAGAFNALSPSRCGPKPASINPLAAELAGVQAENARLVRRLERAEAIIDLQKSCGPAWESASADRRRAVMEALRERTRTSFRPRRVDHDRAVRHSRPVERAVVSREVASPAFSRGDSGEPIKLDPRVRGRCALKCYSAA